MRFKPLNAFVIPVFALTLSWAASAAADSPPMLRGSYGFTGTAACLVATGHVGDPAGPALPNPTPGIALPNSGFQANLVPNDAAPGSPTAAYSTSFAVEGIRTFTALVPAP
jgi:hypothetical protein